MNNRDERGILAQHIQVNKAKLQLNKVKRELDNINKSQLEQELSIKEMEELIDSELFDLGIEVKNIDLNLIQVEDVIRNEDKQWIKDKNKNKFSKLKGIEFNDYESYINSINMYLEECNIDITKDPITQIFSQDELIKLLDKYNDNYGKLKWSKLDYTVIGISAVIAILLDIFIVAIPKDMKFLGKEYKGSILTKKFKDVTVNIYEGNSSSKLGQWINKALKELENYAKVPYDVSRNGVKGVNIDGLRPGVHRFMSLGHDPILGFIVGVIDILRGTMTTIDKNGVLSIVNITEEGACSIFQAFLIVFAHLLSDVCTRAGIAPPFMSLLQLITGKTDFILRKNGQKVGLNDVVRSMYANGYDMRHMATMSIVPLTVEMIIRTYYNLYYFDSLFDNEKNIIHKCKKNNMLAVAHCTVMSGDILKMWIYGWNPVAFNYSEFLMLVKSVISSIRSENKYNEMIQSELENRWYEIITYYNIET